MCPVGSANRCPFLLPPIVRNIGRMFTRVWMRRWNRLVPLPHKLVIVDTVERGDWQLGTGEGNWGNHLINGGSCERD